MVQDAHSKTNRQISTLANTLGTEDGIGYLTIPNENIISSFVRNNILHLVCNNLRGSSNNQVQAMRINLDNGQRLSDIRLFTTLNGSTTLRLRAFTKSNHYVAVPTEYWHLIISSLDGHAVQQGYSNYGTIYGLASDASVYYAAKTHNNNLRLQSFERISLETPDFDTHDYTIPFTASDSIHLAYQDKLYARINNNLYEFDDSLNLTRTRTLTLGSGLFAALNYLWVKDDTKLIPIDPDSLVSYQDISYHKAFEYDAITKITQIQSKVDDNLDATISSRLPTANYSPTDLTSITADVTAVKNQTDKMIFENVAIQGEDPVYRLSTHTWFETIAGTNMTAGAFLSQFHNNINTALTRLNLVKDKTDKLGFTNQGSVETPHYELYGVVVIHQRLTGVRAAKLDHLDSNISTRLSATNFTDVFTNTRQSYLDNLNHLDANISSRLATADYSNPNTKLDNIKSQTDKMRFTGAVDQAGKQKIDASATVTGNVESSGLTEEQNTQLDHIYNQTLVNTEDDSTSLREQVNAIKSGVDQIPTTQVDISNLATSANVTSAKESINTNINANETKIDAIKTVVDSIPSDLVDISNLATSTELTNAKNSIETEVNANETKLDTLQTSVNAIPTNTASPNDIPSGDITNIKAKTDKMQFTRTNDIKATLDGETVTTDQASRTAAHTDLTGIARTADITSAHTTTNTKIDNIKTVADSIKTKSDKLTFNDTNDILASLDGETVTTGDVTDAALQQIREEIEQEDNKVHDIQTKVTAIKSTVDTNLDSTVSSRATPEDITQARDSINQNVNQNETKLDGIKERTDKLYFEGEDKGDREKVHTYTTVEIGDTPVTIDLSTVEEGIEEIITQLTENTDEDNTETILKKLLDTKLDVTYIKRLTNANMRVTDQGVLEFYDSEGVIIKFLQADNIDTLDWSGGRQRTS